MHKNTTTKHLNQNKMNKETKEKAETLLSQFPTREAAIETAKVMEKGFRKYLTIWTNVRKYIEQHEKHN